MTRVTRCEAKDRLIEPYPRSLLRDPLGAQERDDASASPDVEPRFDGLDTARLPGDMPRADGGDGGDAPDPREALTEKQKNAWKTPGAAKRRAKAAGDPPGRARQVERLAPGFASGDDLEDTLGGADEDDAGNAGNAAADAMTARAKDAWKLPRRPRPVGR